MLVLIRASRLGLGLVAHHKYLLPLGVGGIACSVSFDVYTHTYITFASHDTHRKWKGGATANKWIQSCKSYLATHDNRHAECGEKERQLAYQGFLSPWFFTMSPFPSYWLRLRVPRASGDAPLGNADGPHHASRLGNQPGKYADTDVGVPTLQGTNRRPAATNLLLFLSSRLAR